MKRIAEICCGSYYDAKQAALGGAERIELNSALFLGGLTPNLPTLQLVKEQTDLKIIAMVRPRAGGFCYLEEDFQVMLRDCALLMKHGADGIAFGCLNPDCSLDVEKNQKMVDIILQNGGEPVFHRAFDCGNEPFRSIEQLIEMGVKRLLTSGLKEKAADGAELIGKLQAAYGNEIEILAGSGVNSQNARKLMDQTGISQIHSSCKSWLADPTTIGKEVSYGFAPPPNATSYDVVSKELVTALIKSIA